MSRTLDPLIESALPELHAARWTQRALDIEAHIRAEEAQPHPNPDTLATLRAEQQAWAAQRFNVETTCQALLDNDG